MLIFRLSQELIYADPAKVKSSLSSNSAIIDFIRIQIYDFENQQWSIHFRYLAFIVSSQQSEIIIKDLGDADVID